MFRYIPSKSNNISHLISSLSKEKKKESGDENILWFKVLMMLVFAEGQKRNKTPSIDWLNQVFANNTGQVIYSFLDNKSIAKYLLTSKKINSYCTETLKKYHSDFKASQQLLKHIDHIIEKTDKIYTYRPQRDFKFTEGTRYKQVLQKLSRLVKNNEFKTLPAKDIAELERIAHEVPKDINKIKDFMLAKGIVETSILTIPVALILIVGIPMKIDHHLEDYQPFYTCYTVAMICYALISMLKYPMTEFCRLQSAIHDNTMMLEYSRNLFYPTHTDQNTTIDYEALKKICLKNSGEESKNESKNNEKKASQLNINFIFDSSIKHSYKIDICKQFNALFKLNQNIAIATTSSKTGYITIRNITHKNLMNMLEAAIQKSHRDNPIPTTTLFKAKQ